MLEYLECGGLEDVRDKESVSLVDGRRFIIAESDGKCRLTMGGDVVDLDEPGVEKFRRDKDDRPKEQTIKVRHLGELEITKFKVAETMILQQIWDRAYVELSFACDARDVFQADMKSDPVCLMEHLHLTLKEAQNRELCGRNFEIAARTGGA
ncbi:hypothetical protein GOB25_31790 [Sinorhizobium meliloti]|nr:hypothetical protein [Sinorhizobium meliloti]